MVKINVLRILVCRIKLETSVSWTEWVILFFCNDFHFLFLLYFSIYFNHFLFIYLFFLIFLIFSSSYFFFFFFFLLYGVWMFEVEDNIDFMTYTELMDNNLWHVAKIFQTRAEFFRKIL